MATNAENIETRITAIITELTAGSWGPDFSDQGRTVQLQAYRLSLLEELKQLQEMRASLGGPFTVLS